MKKLLLIAGALTVAAAANAQLTIDVTGVPGSGITVWEFGGATGTTSAAGTVRDVTNNTFNAGDTGQFPFGQDTILDTLIQDQVFTLTGTAMVTIGTEARTIGGIFLDDDGGSADDLGIRTDTDLVYVAGQDTSWTGSGVANVDITAFAGGVWSINSTDGQAMFISDPTIVTFTAVPEPATMIALGAGLAALAARRRRK